MDIRTRWQRKELDLLFFLCKKALGKSERIKTFVRVIAERERISMWKLDAAVECFIGLDGGGGFRAFEQSRVSLASVTFFILYFASSRVRFGGVELTYGLWETVKFFGPIRILPPPPCLLVVGFK